MRISEKEFRELLDRYLTNTASPEERAIIDRFFESYQPGLFEDANDNNSRLQDEILHDIHARIRSKDRKRRSRLILWLPLAAVVSLFVLAYFLTEAPSVDTRETACAVIEVNTARGQRSVTLLPDGTTVHLNSGSKLSYCDHFGESIREVKLWGEAYFEVVKTGKPFLVQTHRMRTEVMGTSFNVKSRGDELAEVTLVEGKVKVISATGASSILSPNQHALIDLSSGAIATREVNIPAYTSWKDNTLFFERTSLKEAVAILESWYAVRIDILNPELAQCTITAKYQDEPLGNVLGSFQFLLTLDIIRLNETHYTINGKGCKRK